MEENTGYNWQKQDQIQVWLQSSLLFLIYTMLPL